VARLPQQRYLTAFLNRFVELIPLLLGIFLLWAALRFAAGSGLTTFILSLTLSLSAAWVAIQLATSVISDNFWAKLVAVSAWSLAALNILGLMDETLEMLKSIGFSIGEVQLTLLSILRLACCC
jgi:hypothetical protein